MTALLNRLFIKPGMLNSNKIDMVIKQLYAETLYLDPAALTPEARF
jgi:hypothetical protein